MEENKYLNEEKYQATAKKLKSIGKTVLIIGIVILVIGVLCTIIGFIKFSMGGLDSVTNTNAFEMPDFSGVGFGFILFFIGMIADGIGSTMSMIGGVMLFIGYKREIHAFTTQQAMPVVKETVNDITPTVASSAGSIAKEVSKGLAEGKEEAKKGDE